MKTLNKFKLIICSLLLVTFFNCNNSESSNGSLEQPTISVRLVDEPGDFEAVNVEVVDVMIKMDNDSDDDNGWISLEAQNETVNLLDFTGGLSKVLVDKFPIPAGTLTQMRLVLGDGNTIVIKNDANEDETFDLKTPSAQQSGLKLKVDALIEEGFTYDFVLDFNVDKSIVFAGNSSNIILKPVLRVTAEVSSGIIEGSVSPSDVAVLASVDTGDEVISAETDENGNFALWGVPAGTYDVVLTPDSESKYKETIVSGVVVVNGEITVIDPAIELALKIGTIKGKVLNEGLAATASITVDGAVVTVNTGDMGVFIFNDVPVGTYTVTISAEGFTSQEIEAIVVEDTETVLADVTLIAI